MPTETLSNSYRNRKEALRKQAHANRQAQQNKDELSQSLIELVDKDMLKRARILGAAFRAAHMVSASMPGVLTNTPIGYEGNRLVWTLPEPYSNLEGERVDRRFKVLADLLDRDAEIRVGPSFQLAAS